MSFNVTKIHIARAPVGNIQNCARCGEVLADKSILACEFWAEGRLISEIDSPQGVYMGVVDASDAPLCAAEMPLPEPPKEN